MFLGKPIGETILYSGCRKEAEDYIYKEELQNYVANGTLSNLYMAFSRDQQEKVYVQHLLKKNAQQAWKAIDAGAHLYICG